MFLNDYDNFMELLHTEITKFCNYCYNKNKKPAVRFNGTSDIQWEYKLYKDKNIFEHFPDVQFYDYTKIYTRVYKDLPSNYHLTLSYSEANMDYAKNIDKACTDTGVSMAVVFDLRWLGELPDTYLGRQVIDGDKDDLRFLDPTNVVVGLKAKGDAKHDTSGFVIRKVA